VTWESARSELVAVRASYEADPNHFGVVNTKTLVSKVPGPIQLTPDDWDILLVPGIRSGAVLASLPTPVGSRPLALPSVLLERNDGQWFQTSDAGTDPICRVILKTLFLSRSKCLVELRFTLGSDGNRLDRVEVLRVFDFLQHFQRVEY